ncbi:MAG: O-antigen ligase family protein [Rhizobiaceae bacterium]
MDDTSASRSIADMARNERPNLYGASLVLLTPALIGSLANVASALFMLFALRRPERITSLVRAPGTARILAAAFAIFFIAEAVAALVNWHGLPSAREIGENLVFLGFLPFLSLFEARPKTILRGLVMFAPAMAVAAFATAMFQLMFLGFRPQGGAGNPAVFAVTVSVIYAVCIAGFHSQSPGQRRMSLGGALLAAATILLSGTRGMWPAIMILPVLYFWIIGRAGRRTGQEIARPVLAGGLAALLIVLTVIYFIPGGPASRVTEGLKDWQLIQQGDFDSSLGKRYAMWAGGTRAALQRPLFGHGPDMPGEIMRNETARYFEKGLAYSHFHNFMLNEMIRAGIAGTLAMLAMMGALLWGWNKPPLSSTGLTGQFLLASLFANYMLSGLFNLAFDHDILDFMFVTGSATFCYLAFGPDVNTSSVRGSASGGAS